MPTKKFNPDNNVAYDPSPVCVKVLPGVRERLRSVDGWRDKVRAYIDSLIEEGGEGG
jgi:hypothetical protein